MRLDKISRGYHFPAERLSFSKEAKTIIFEDMPAMMEDSEEEITEILCVSI